MIHTIVLVALLFVGDTTAQAANTPTGWPWHGVSMGFPEATPKDIERYKNELGINMVRLQIKARKFAQTKRVSGDEALNEGIRWADGMLDECARLGITAVVNIGGFPLNPEKANQTTATFWSNDENKREVVNVTQRLAEHFRERGTELAAYDIISEPVVVEGKKSLTPTGWIGLLEQIISTIEKHDPKRWLVIAPGPWGGPGGYSKFSPPEGERLIWGVHVYIPHRFTHQGIRKNDFGIKYPGRAGNKYWDKAALKKALTPLKKFQKEHGGLVWVGEFSAIRWAEGGEQHIRDLTSIFDEYGWGWAYFSGSGWHGWNPDYNQNYSGKDSAGDWRKDYVGESSVRWQTLREIFGVKQGISKHE